MKDYVRELIDVVGKGGRFILGSATSLDDAKLLSFMQRRTRRRV